MAVKFSTTVKNARLNAIETAIGTAPVLKLRTGSPPANITDADSGTVVATMTLPSDWMGAAASGVIDLVGSWLDSSADSTNVVGHYRLYASDGTTQHIQGTVTATGGGGDMEINNTSVSAGQQVSVTQFRFTEGN